MTTVKKAGLATIDMKLEVIVIPVSDTARAEQFYRKLGWRQDVTPPGSGVFQFTPHGSACSVQFGKGLSSAAPGSAQRTYLIVSDIEATRNALVDSGIDVSEIPLVTSFGSASDLASAMRRAEAAHGEHEKRLGQRDANWSDWYADYMAAEQAGAELPT